MWVACSFHRGLIFLVAALNANLILSKLLIILLETGLGFWMFTFSLQISKQKAGLDKP